MAAGNKRHWSAQFALFLCKWGFIGAVMAAILIGLYGAMLAPSTPSASELEAFHKHRSSVLLSADGEVLARFGRRGRKWVSLDAVSPHVVDALIATEDRRFYTHNGIDIRRTVAAAVYTLLGDRQGGSTITQQLARNMYPDKIGGADPLTRKLMEMITARTIESVFSKEKILETYLNTVPFLYNAFGIDMAARTYFNTSARELTIPQSATLVGMLKGTAYYNPVRHPERALQRRNVVLRQLVKQGHIDAERFNTLRQEPLGMEFHSQLLRDSVAPHFAEYVRKKVQKWAEGEGINLFTDGLTIHTTLDIELQKAARESVKRWGDALQQVADVEWGRSTNQLLSTSTNAYVSRHDEVEPFSAFWSSHPKLLNRFIRESRRYQQGINRGVAPAVMLDSLQQNNRFLDSLRSTKTRLEAGLTAIEPENGHIKAWVGSRDFLTDQYDHVATARRQAGSTFKPFVYAAALERGYTPKDSLPDTRVTITTANGKPWQPVNASEISGENVTLRTALTHSKNTVTARLTQEVGPLRVVRTARQLGVNRSTLKDVPSVGLGTSEVSLLEMVSAYATIANRGTYLEPRAVTHIQDSSGKILARFNSSPQQAVAEETALTLIDMMRGVVNEGTAKGVRDRFNLTADLAGKTGTTQHGADGWFIMAHPQLVVGSWVGFNDPRITFRSNYWGQGAHNGLYVVSDLFQEALRSGNLASSVRFPDPPSYPDKDDSPAIAERVGSWLGKVADRIGEAFKGDRSPEPRDTGPRSEDRSEAEEPPEREPETEEEPSSDQSKERRRGGW